MLGLSICLLNIYIYVHILLLLFLLVRKASVFQWSVSTMEMYNWSKLLRISGCFCGLGAKVIVNNLISVLSPASLKDYHKEEAERMQELEEEVECVELFSGHRMAVDLLKSEKL